MKALFVALLVLVVLNGCERQNAKQAPPVPMLASNSAANSVSINAATPDLALKTWWKVLDANSEYGYVTCIKAAPDESPLSVNRDKILTGDVKIYFSHHGDRCSRETYSREIDEVKIESDTRATILATIKNSTPLPGDVHLEEWQTKERTVGKKYKYLMERDSAQEGWKVSQVYSYTEYPVNGSNWDTEYDLKYVDTHAFVFGQ